MPRPDRLSRSVDLRIGYPLPDMSNTLCTVQGGQGQGIFTKAPPQLGASFNSSQREPRTRGGGGGARVLLMLAPGVLLLQCLLHFLDSIDVWILVSRPDLHWIVLHTVEIRGA